MTERLDQEHICGVCARLSAGYGYRPFNVKSPAPRDGQFLCLWVCDDPECLEIARDTYAMKQAEWDKREAEAAIQGGGKGFGAVIDRAGMAHIFETMPPELFAEAMKAAIAGYRAELKRLMSEHAAPF